MGSVMRTIILILFLSLPAVPQMLQGIVGGKKPVAAGGGSATFRDYRSNVEWSNVTTLATSGTLAVTAGDLIVVMVGIAGTQTSITVTCGSDSLTLAKSSANIYNNYQTRLFYKQNASANATASCSTTFTTASGATYIQAANYGGVATSSALKEVSCNDAACETTADSATSRTAQNVTTTAANSLLIGVGHEASTSKTWTVANSYTVRSANPGFIWWFDKSVNATGTHPNGNFATGNSADEYTSLFAAFALQ